MKDFYDLWVQTEHSEFNGAILQKAVESTFKRRRTELPTAVPAGLRGNFATDAVRADMWAAFLRRSEISDAPPLADVVVKLRAFLMPLSRQEASRLDWNGGRWNPAKNRPPQAGTKPRDPE